MYFPEIFSRRKNASPRAKHNSRRSGARFEWLESRLLLAAVTFDTPSRNSGDGSWVLEQREGTDVHISPAYLYYNVNLPSAFPDFTTGDTLYLKVNYYDEGLGTLRVQYDSLDANNARTQYHSRSSMVDTQQFVSSHHVLTNAEFANGLNGNDFRVDVDGAPVSTVIVSDQPFQGSGLEWFSAIPWESPYSGPSRDDVDASTLDGKMMVGYQGWFNTPNDLEDIGFQHWGRPGDWDIDQWPDSNDYDASELFAVPGVSTARGDQAYLFSSNDASVVHRHFQWMRQHDIDGVFLQRFKSSILTKNSDGTYSGPTQFPLTNVREAAHREGRTWAIEYDIQKGGDEAERDAMIQAVKDDWEFLTDQNGFDLLNDSHYQHEDGKPVVAVYGLYVTADNAYSTAQQIDLINFFKSRGIYFVGAGRHPQSSSQLANAGLHDAYIPWQGYWVNGNSFAPNETILDGITQHIPHVFPGFSWTHKRDDSDASSRDRENGLFYWRMLNDAVNETDAPWLFIGMFDEYDEATNLIPASDDPPTPDTGQNGNPLTFQTSDPRPNDWWLALTRAGKQALQGKTTISDSIPTESDLENRSNVGGEAVWQASGSDRLAVIDIPGGHIQTMNFTVDGESFDAIYSSANFMDFQVDDSFLLQETDGRDVTIEVEYLDSVVGQFGVEYDSTTGTYKAGDPAPLTGSGQWRTHRFDLSDASFGNNQNEGSDFRLKKIGGNLFVRRIRVIKESLLTVDVDLGVTNSINGLQQVEYAGDGQTVTTTSGGRGVRLLSGTPTSLYMYMRVDDDFANHVQAGLNTVVEVVYQDIGTGILNIQYDSTSAAYKTADPVLLENSGEWRTARFYLDDALFGNSQNGGSDFRITGNNIPIDQVRVLHSFGDLVAPTLQTTAATVNAPQNMVAVTWSMTDDWKTGLMDQWTEQEDNHVQIAWTGDGGSTWNPVDEVYEQFSATAQSSYDSVTGQSTWSDETTWDTSSLAAGTYQIRVTPTDGRGNAGVSAVTFDFDVNVPPDLLGDYNYDQAVNSADIAVWSGAYGSSVPMGTGADGTMNGFVDGGDFLVWQRNFGAALPMAIAADDSISLAAPSEAELTMASAHADSTEWIDASIAGFAMLIARNRSIHELDHSGFEPATESTRSSDNELNLLLAGELVRVWRNTSNHDGMIRDEIFSADSEISDLLVDLEQQLLANLAGASWTDDTLS